MLKNVIQIVNTLIEIKVITNEIMSIQSKKLKYEFKIFSYCNIQLDDEYNYRTIKKCG